MSEVNIQNKDEVLTVLQLRSDNASAFDNAATKIPLKGEAVVYLPDETTSHTKLKIGNGTKTLSNLDFVGDDIREDITAHKNSDNAHKTLISNMINKTLEDSNFLTAIPEDYVTEEEINTTLEGYYTVNDADDKFQPKGSYVLKSELPTIPENIVNSVKIDQTSLTGDLTFEAVGGATLSISNNTIKFGAPSGSADGPSAEEVELKLNAHKETYTNPHKVTKQQVGLGNLDNIRQYSASNPPPYPVKSITINEGDALEGHIKLTIPVNQNLDTYTNVFGSSATFGTDLQAHQNQLVCGKKNIVRQSNEAYFIVGGNGTNLFEVSAEGGVYISGVGLTGEVLQEIIDNVPTIKTFAINLNPKNLNISVSCKPSGYVQLKLNDDNKTITIKTKYDSSSDEKDDTYDLGYTVNKIDVKLQGKETKELKPNEWYLISTDVKDNGLYDVNIDYDRAPNTVFTLHNVFDNSSISTTVNAANIQVTLQSKQIILKSQIHKSSGSVENITVTTIDLPYEVKFITIQGRRLNLNNTMEVDVGKVYNIDLIPSTRNLFFFKLDDGINTIELQVECKNYFQQPGGELPYARIYKKGDAIPTIDVGILTFTNEGTLATATFKSVQELEFHPKYLGVGEDGDVTYAFEDTCYVPLYGSAYAYVAPGSSSIKSYSPMAHNGVWDLIEDPEYDA